MRVVGIDIGTRRIGVAVSDPSGSIASPYRVLERTGDPDDDLARLADVVREVAGELVVVGLPISLNGREGRAARAVRREADALAGMVGVPVVMQDERLTTVSAQRSMREAGVKSPAQRGTIDKVAASLILQTWLDGRR